MTYDLTVIGGGAAGFFAAITCAETADRPMRIVILEKAGDVLQKVKISGGGRCNVTHDCHDPREFVTHYPRGERTLNGPLHRWNAADMIEWLEAKGVELKVESDGRMFPVTDDSQTVIDCFLKAADDLGIEIRCSEEVVDVDSVEDHFELELRSGERFTSGKLLIATGGIRTASGAEFAEKLGHTTQPAAPSLFTFKIDDPRIEELAGVSVPHCIASIPDTKFRESGPILITHWGLSGPGILKLSARGARELQQQNYHFPVVINWVGDRSAEQISEELAETRTSTGKQSVYANTKFSIPVRFWKRICDATGLPTDLKWGNISRKEIHSLVEELTHSTFNVTGKSMNKDEFVTCGGVTLKEVNFKTMESKLCPGLYFAGEVLDIDGITGGFNFQSAWTTGRIAGESIAQG